MRFMRRLHHRYIGAVVGLSGYMAGLRFLYGRVLHFLNRVSHLFFYRAWFLIAYCCIVKKVSRQQIYGMPTGSVIV